MRIEVAPALQTEQAMEQWMLVWRLTVLRVLPPSQAGTDDLDDLSLRPWWKVKKVAMDIALRFFQESSSPLNEDEQSKKNAAIFIGGGIAGNFLVISMNLLQAWVTQDAPLPRLVIFVPRLFLERTGMRGK